MIEKMKKYRKCPALLVTHFLTGVTGDAQCVTSSKIEQKLPSHNFWGHLKIPQTTNKW